MSYPSDHINRFRKLTLIGALSLCVAACATSAPPIPEDTTSNNRQKSLSSTDFSAEDNALSCEAIETEEKANADKIDADNKAIQSNRRQNEVAGYLGGMLIVPLVATESNSQEKDDIQKLQARQDILLKLAAFKKCNVSPMNP